MFWTNFGFMSNSSRGKNHLNISTASLIFPWDWSLYIATVSSGTEEIVEEQDEHQVFFSAAGVGMEFVYMDFDSNGNPVGTQFVLAPLGAGSGSVTITLVHEPAKPNDGLDTAGGSIDIQTTFPVTVE